MVNFDRAKPKLLRPLRYRLKNLAYALIIMALISALMMTMKVDYRSESAKRALHYVCSA